ncbi:hypothetical protein ABPG75_007497 [Micractinium tetrahymenae]
MLSATATTRVPFTPVCAGPRSRRSLCVRATAHPNQEPSWRESMTKGAAAFFSTALVAGAASACTYDELQSLSYKEVKGSGLANMCPSLGADAKDGLEGMKPGSFHMEGFCMEPTSFKIKPLGSNRFEPSTLLTRNTYSLDQQFPFPQQPCRLPCPMRLQMSGTFKVESNGNVEIQEEDGFDFQPVTVKASWAAAGKGPWSGFTGEFDVNNSRGASFMDPLGRGGTTGWDYQKGLQAAGSQDELDRENFKRVDPSRGQAAFAISKVGAASGEVAGGRLQDAAVRI